MAIIITHWALFNLVVVQVLKGPFFVDPGDLFFWVKPLMPHSTDLKNFIRLIELCNIFARLDIDVEAIGEVDELLDSAREALAGGCLSKKDKISVLSEDNELAWVVAADDVVQGLAGKTKIASVMERKIVVYTEDDIRGEIEKGKGGCRG
ncbi:hypothetical protein B0T14DRAFT_563257 [Immersiella caudata]|uniref:Uncharacterized protein n=1 Tax=Immersiella caudata TaxID=314043 RepID=A0AA39X613_9PEZI|nr:hypothetical protein B0T14DRAFT_563257 [Immersiella caudata]